jgi:Domain of unknown function (DUF4234)
MTDATPTPPEPSDAVPSPPPASTPPPPAPTPPPPASASSAAPAVGNDVVKVRSPAFVIVISIITLGIYHLYWIYQVYRELKETTREGIGPVLGLVLAIVVNVVNWFVLPSEIGNMYEQSGQQKPVSGLTGLWVIVPFVGWIVWLVKVQGALNREWERLGA